jgi:hypothetical protein
MYLSEEVIMNLPQNLFFPVDHRRERAHGFHIDFHDSDVVMGDPNPNQDPNQDVVMAGQQGNEDVDMEGDAAMVEIGDVNMQEPMNPM